MSVQTEIDRLQAAKSDLKAAIEEKGVAVPDAATLDGYGALVSQIRSGGTEIGVFSFRKEMSSTAMVIRQMDGQTVTLSSGADSRTVGGIAFSYNKMNWELYAEQTVFYNNQLYFAGEYIDLCSQDQSCLAGWLQFPS